MRKFLALFCLAFFTFTLAGCDDDQPTDVEGATVAHVNLQPPEQGDSNIRGQLTIEDDGSTIRIAGVAKNLQPSDGLRYISLFYGLGAAATGPNACEQPGASWDTDGDGEADRTGPGNEEDQLSEPKMIVGGWKVDAAGNGNLRALNWNDFTFMPGPVVMTDGDNAAPNYVSIENVSTVSIRDLTITEEPNTDPGFGPDAVVACGRVVIDN